MDRLTGNTLLGWPTYNTVHLNGASYRQIQFDHPQDQCSFNCYQWQAPSGSAWKSKFTPRAASQADEDERHPYDNYVLLPRTTDDVEGDGGDDGDSSVPVGIHGVKPGCFWEDEDQEMSDQEGAIKFDRSRNCWITAVAFPKALVGLLFGKNQSNLKRLEASTRTQIIVSPGDANSPEASVSISSTVSPECVEAAVEKVTRMSSVSPRSPEPVIESSEKWWRKKSDSVQKRLYTHFLSLPIREDYFRRQFSSFRSQALRNNYAGVDAFFFQLPTRLHLTICMLNLDTEDKVAECKRVIEGLQAAVYDAVDTRTVLLEFRGVEVMNDDETDAAVVITRPTKSEKLDKVNIFSRTLIEGLVTAGLATWDQLHRQRCLCSDGNTVDIKFHATLLNAKFASNSGREPSHKKSASNRSHVDLSRLVRDFKYMNFGKVAFKEVHLSSLMEFDATTAYYKCIAQCKLP